MKKEFLKATLGAGVILVKDGHVLLVKPNYGKAKGHWILPGGFVDSGESPQQCAQREVLEETGLKAKITDPVAIRFRPLGESADVYWVFRGELEDLSLQELKKKIVWQESELEEAAFMPVSEAIASDRVRPMTVLFLKIWENKEAVPMISQQNEGRDTVYRCG